MDKKIMDKKNKKNSPEKLNELATVEVMEFERLNFHVCDRFKPFSGDMVRIHMRNKNSNAFGVF